LEDLVRQGRIKFANGTVNGEQRDFAVPKLPAGMADEDLFGHAMQDVKALGWSNVPLHYRPPLEIQPQNDEENALRALESFLQNGDIEVEQTPEYIEAAVQPRGRLYLKDLRSGRFSVQAWLDLHGMNQQEARFALDEFILASARASLSCVRVIHGRGRHSHKKQPVLKDAVQRWLCSRRLSRHVVAYTSARSCDGGGGAVYILLRS
jgi:DNA-nicking Smr family endonuclease